MRANRLDTGEEHVKCKILNVKCKSEPNGGRQLQTSYCK